MKSRTSYKVIGVMSGTSLDGLDIACCRFIKKKQWEFKIQSAQTFSYSGKWRDLLARAHELSSEHLLMADAAYGRFIGECCQRFIRKQKIKGVDFISSHGHTLFHQPHHAFTFQLGNGNAISAASGIPVVYDFRSLDVALGGQGAPLVPMGDRHLFGQYDACLNMGGIANLSMERRGKREAFDICFANMGLNYLARKAGKELDRGARRALRGKVDMNLLEALTLSYGPFRKKRPALTREGFESGFQRLLDDESVSLNNRMRTFCESIADEIVRGMPQKRTGQQLLVTGGGAHNPLLTKLLSRKLSTRARLVIPPRPIIEFKEALVFAFLGVLRVRGEVNVLRSVTHARRDSCSGAIVGEMG